MTARPSPYSPIAGYARCLQRDQHYRCTVGHFNWVPDIFDIEGTNSHDVIRTERHTALHEITHILGGIMPGLVGQRTHIQSDGTLMPLDDIVVVETDGAGYSKDAIKIKTPRVLSMARKHFGCDTLTGVALEDVPLGRGAHWEARLLGPEFMSYGSDTGEVYISDLTLAYLEDTST